MRKIELALAGAIHTFNRFSDSNTVFHRMDGTDEGWELLLHGNSIAVFDSGDENPTVPLRISFAGWPTKTTCSRLNALDGVRVNIKNGVPYLNGHQIDAEGWWNPRTGNCY